jgi:hypothetical protein
MSGGWPPAYGPGKFDPSGLDHNPARQLPAPFPRDGASAGWFGAAVPLRFAPGGGGVIQPQWQVSWRSPIFDLRPQFRGVPSAPGGSLNTGANQVASQPIWLPQGGGGKLFVQVLLDLANTADMDVTAVESAHPTDVTRVATITGPQDISGPFAPNKAAALVSFVPPGSGYPVRYWQITITWDVFGTLAAQPAMTLQAGYY